MKNYILLLCCLIFFSCKQKATVIKPVSLTHTVLKSDSVFIGIAVGMVYSDGKLFAVDRKTDNVFLV